jgi:hypothetical protein
VALGAKRRTKGKTPQTAENTGSPFPGALERSSLAAGTPRTGPTIQNSNSVPWSKVRTITRAAEMALLRPLLKRVSAADSQGYGDGDGQRPKSKRSHTMRVPGRSNHKPLIASKRRMPSPLPGIGMRDRRRPEFRKLARIGPTCVYERGWDGYDIDSRATADCEFEAALGAMTFWRGLGLGRYQRRGPEGVRCLSGGGREFHRYREPFTLTGPATGFWASSCRGIGKAL